MKSNGPLKMYLTKQIVRHDLPVQLPPCMYKLKNIHTPKNGTVIKTADHVSREQKNLDISEQVKLFLQNQQVLPEMATLLLRQEKILQQLKDLKEQMYSIRAELNVSNTDETCISFLPIEITAQASEEIIINASPSHPPYSLLIIQKLLANVNFHITTHVHSNVSKLPENANQFVVSHSEKPDNSSTINIRLIWKEVGAHMELIVSGARIMGEANILRYLSRTFPALEYESSNPFEIDSVLDMCYCIVSSKTKTERSALLQSLNKKLGKSQWFCGRKNITIADVAAFSAIKQVALNEANANLTKWVKQFDALCL